MICLTRYSVAHSSRGDAADEHALPRRHADRQPRRHHAARAPRARARSPLIAAEDTRSARVLLNHYGIDGATSRATTSTTRARRRRRSCDALDDGDVALVSDAGMPAISDPGPRPRRRGARRRPRRRADPGRVGRRRRGRRERPAVAALSLPRLPAAPVRAAPARARRRPRHPATRSSCTSRRTASRATLDDALAALGDRRIAVCRELTKLHEEIWRGTLSGAIAHFAEPRGEFTLVIEGGAPSADPESPGRRRGRTSPARRRPQRPPSPSSCAEVDSRAATRTPSGTATDAPPFRGLRL